MACLAGGVSGVLCLGCCVCLGAGRGARLPRDAVLALLLETRRLLLGELGLREPHGRRRAREGGCARTGGRTGGRAGELGGGRERVLGLGRLVD
eukprot:6104378-Prymnesium_polylepis.1